jgi:hypothetical protein
MTKRKAENASPNKRKPKRRAAASQKDTKPESPVAKAYRRKHAARFDKPTAGPSKPESGSYDVYAFPPTLPSPPPSDKHSPPTQPKGGDTLPVEKGNVRESEQTGASAHTIPADIPEDTLLDILCDPYDSELIKTALDGVMQLAAAAARPGDEFGVLFMQNFVNKLAGLHINGTWLAEVVDTLQQDLRSLCDRAQCQIGSLGKLALRKGKAAESHLGMAQARDAMQAEANPDQEHFPRTVYVKHGSAKAESVNIEEYATHPDSHVVPAKKQRKGGRRRTKETPQRSSLQSLVQHAITQGLDTPDEASQTWQPNDRTSSFYLSNAPLNSVYDLFVVCAIDAHRFSIGEPIEVINAYVNRVRKIWHRVESDHKAGWVKLFNARPEVDPPSVRGQRLLESQGLLVKFLPNACMPKHAL